MTASLQLLVLDFELPQALNELELSLLAALGYQADPGLPVLQTTSLCGQLLLLDYFLFKLLNRYTKRASHPFQWPLDPPWNQL